MIQRAPWRCAPILAVTLLLAYFPVPLRSQGAPPDSVPVIVSVSGGISLGAYEAGVNWAIVEFLRASQTPEFRHPLGLDHSMYLGAATGASAGNVNGLISALEACADTPTAPEHSLFWRMWVHTGIEQLMNEKVNDGRNKALFHRDFLTNAVFRDVVERMNRPGRRSCDIPVGLALTRMVPDSVVLDPDNTIWVPTQRFVAAYRLRRDDDGRLAMVQPHPGVHADRSIGKLIIPPLAGDGQHISPDSVLKFVSASGAFPIAFEPVEMRYLDRDSLDSGWQCRRGGDCGTTARFIDGGAFDNNPLALALGLYLTRPGADSLAPGVRVVYIDPSLTRGRLHSIGSARDTTPPAPRGLSAVVDVASPLVTSARKYELQALARALERDRRAGEVQKSWLRATSRSQPIFGEHLGAFGAFLGRPLREYDFYVGMYDGLRFAARDLLCTGQPGTCTQQQLRTLLLSAHIPFGEVAPRALRHFYQDEYGDALPSPGAPAEQNSAETNRAVQARVLFLEALLHANHQIRFAAKWDDAEECGAYRWQERLTCTGGFAEVLGRAAAMPKVRDEVAFWARNPDCSWSKSDSAPEVCPVEGNFHRLMTDPEEYTVRLTDRMVHQLWRVEAALRYDPKTAGYSKERLVEWVEMLYRGAGPRRAVTFGWPEGWDPDPSSIQTFSTHWGRRPMQFPVPYGLSVADGNGVELSYRPTFYPSRKVRDLSFITPASFTARSGGTYDVSLGAGIRWTPSMLSPFVSSIETAWQPLHSFDPYDEAHTSTRTGTLAVQLIADRLRVGVRYLDDPDPAFNGGRHVWYSVGIADFNGLMYWLIRTR